MLIGGGRERKNEKKEEHTQGANQPKASGFQRNQGRTKKKERTKVKAGVGFKTAPTKRDIKLNDASFAF